MEFKNFVNCLRCRSNNLVKSCPPIIYCMECGAIATFSLYSTSHNGLLRISFKVNEFHVNIRYFDNKTVINDNLEINCLLPIDITEEKLKTYIIFS